jgi:hypothetical protein
VAVDGLAVDVLEELEEGRVRARAGVLGRWGEQVDVADGAGESDDLDTVGQLQVFLGDGAGRDTANGLARATPAAAAARLDAVLFEVGPVGVAGSRVDVHGLVAIVWK